MARSEISQQDKKLIVRLLKENFKKHAKWYGIAIVAMFVIAATTAASAHVMKPIVNNVISGASMTYMTLVASFVAFLFIFKGIATYVQMFFLSKAGNSIVAEQQRKIYNRLMQQGVSYYQKMESSDLLVRVTHNANAARSIIDVIVTTFVRDLLTVFGLITVMLYNNFMLSALALTVGPIAFVGVRMIVKRVRGLMQQELTSIAEIIKVMQETSIGIRVIKAFSLEEKMKDRMNRAVSNVEKRANSIASLNAATSPIMETLAGIAIALVIWISGYMASNNPNAPGELMAFITSLLLAYEPAKRLANVRVRIETGMVGVRTMFEILDHPISMMEDENAVDLKEGNGEIKLDHVRFAYNDGHDVLHDISLKIPACKMTALVGPSGSGKSTMINLIMRLYDPTQGTITFDGQDIRFVTFKSLRERMSYVGQDVFLFNGSVKHNIALGSANATDEEIIEAAKAANAHDFILELEKGYDTNVGDNGGNLSGGQKQRIAIARAMLRNSEILILDEATSALDSESEAAIREALQRLTKDRTTIVIAHRLSTISRADKIVVMEKGTIVEQGTQRELLELNGLYRRLHDLQFQDPEIEALYEDEEDNNHDNYSYKASSTA